MRIAIYDDNRKEREQFINALHGRDPTRQPECFRTGALLEAARGQEKEYFDIVFGDIYMPGEYGVCIDAFSLHALHDLVKPAQQRVWWRPSARSAEPSDSYLSSRLCERRGFEGEVEL
ncbi:MAG: response regulator [Eubacteriales bacterium]|nr:response regulator [Eubacteriales bacterium]